MQDSQEGHATLEKTCTVYHQRFCSISVEEETKGETGYPGFIWKTKQALK